MWLQVYLRPIAVQMTICEMTWNSKTCFYGTLIGCNCCAFRDSALLPVLKGSIILPSFLVNKPTTNITITHTPTSCLHFSRASFLNLVSDSVNKLSDCKARQCDFLCSLGGIHVILRYFLKDWFLPPSFFLSSSSCPFGG